MRFGLTNEQEAFAHAIGGLLADSDVPSVARSWASGDPTPGLKLWSELGALGVTALRVPEAQGGVGGQPVDLVVAFEQLGYHAVPGPWIEAVALAPPVLAAAGDPDAILPGLAEGSARVGVAAPPLAPYALDAATADQVYVVTQGSLSRGVAGAPLESVDRSRRLTSVTEGERIATLGEEVVRAALDEAVLACAAQLLGGGRRLLDDAVGYAGTRQQFGRVIGQYQAVKHALADVKVALDFAGPLVHGAAESVAAGGPGAAIAVSAAKVATASAAHRAARTAPQVHGAIGYTEEFDLSIWLTKVQALLGAWGTSSWHRERVLGELVSRRR